MTILYKAAKHRLINSDDNLQLIHDVRWMTFGVIFISLQWPFYEEYDNDIDRNIDEADRITNRLRMRLVISIWDEDRWFATAALTFLRGSFVPVDISIG